MQSTHPDSVQAARDIIREIHKNEKHVIENTDERTKNRIEAYHDSVLNDLDNEAQVLVELLQNADDVETCTTVEIHLTEDRLVVENDGRPMYSTEVDALCQVGQSTKQDLRYIGHFGQGFKSVFSVSERPHVHSGYFQLYFEKHTPTLPQVAADTAFQHETAPETSGYVSGTRIELPLDVSETQYERLEDQILDANELLPYLKNVTTLKITTPNQQTAAAYTRQQTDIKTDISAVTITKNGELFERRLLFDVERTLPDDQLEHLIERRNLKQEFDDDETYTTTITISVTVDKHDVPIINTESSRLYSYFPTKELTGLPFDIQADFVLTRDRNHLQRFDDPVNEWILAQLELVYERIVDYYIEHDDESVRFAFYSLFPDRDTVAPEVAHLTDQFHRVLQQRAVVPGVDGCLHQPQQIGILSAPFSSLYEHAEFETLCNGEYVLPKEDFDTNFLTLLCNEELTTTITAADIVAYSQSTTLYSQWPASRLYQFIAALGETYLSDRTRITIFMKEKLRSITCYPVESGAVISLEETATTPFLSQPTNDLHYDVFEDVLVLADDLFTDCDGTHLDQSTRDSARFVLEDALGLDTISDEVLIKEILNPAFETPTACDQDVLDAYLVYLFELDDPDLWEHAAVQLRSREGSEPDRTAVQSATSDSLPKYTDPTALYLPPAYEGDCDLALILRFNDDVTWLSEAYLELFDAPIDDIRQFMCALGVVDRIQVVETPPDDREMFRSHSDVRQRLEQLGSDDPEIPDSVEHNGTSQDTWLRRATYGLSDYRLDPHVRMSLKIAIEKGLTEATAETLQEFLRALNSNWERFAAATTWTLYHVETEGAYHAVATDTTCESTFLTFLKSNAWLPSQSGTLAAPPTLLVENQFTIGYPETDLLGEYRAAGVDLTTQLNDSLLKTLDINRRRDLRSVVTALEYFATETDDETDPATIRKQVTTYLRVLETELEAATEAERQAAIDDIATIPFIYVADSEPAYRRLDQVFWSGRDIGSYLVSIEDHYVDYKSLFKTLDIQLEPTLADCVEFIEHHHTAQSATASEDVTEIVERIVKELGQIVETVGVSKAHNRKPVEKLRDSYFPTLDGHLAAVSELHYYCESATLRDYLTDSALGSETIVYPGDRLTRSNRQNAYDVLGLTAVTDEIDRELVTRSPVSSADHEHSWDDDVVARILDVAWSLAIESMAASQTDTDASARSVQLSAIKTTLKEIATYCCVPAETLACRWVRDGTPVTPEFSVDAFINDTTTAIYYHTAAGEDAYYHVADLVFEIIEPVVDQQDQIRDWLHGSLGKPEPLLKSYLASKDVSYQPLPVDSSPADQRRSAEGSSTEDGDDPAERSESTDNQSTTEEPAQSDDTGTQAGSTQVNSDAESLTGSQSESTQPDSVHTPTTANGSNQSQTDTNESRADPSSSPRSNGHTTTADTSGSSADDSPFGNGAEGSHSSVQDELDAVSCLPQAATLTDALSSSNQGTHRPNETITTSPNSNPYALSTEPADDHQALSQTAIGLWGEEFIYDLVLDLITSGLAPVGETTVDRARDSKFGSSTESSGQHPYSNRFERAFPGATVQLRTDTDEHEIRVLDVSNHTLGTDLLIEGAKIARAEASSNRRPELRVAAYGDYETMIEVKSSHECTQSFNLTQAEYCRAQNEPQYVIVKLCGAGSNQPHIDGILENIQTLEDRDAIAVEEWQYRVTYDRSRLD